MAWFSFTAVVDGNVAVAADLNTPLSNAANGTVTPAHGGTGLTTATSGGILYGSSSSAIAFSSALTQYGIVYGGGAGASPGVTAAGTTGQFLIATTSGAPSWSSTLAMEDSRTATTVAALTLTATTSGTPAAGIGTAMLVKAESADENPSNVGQWEFAFSDIDAGSEDSFFSLLLRVAGRALDEKYRFASTAGDGFTAIFTHANTADRTYTLPDASVSLGVFVGALAKKSAVQSVNSASNDLLTWDQEEYDTSAIHDTGSNTSRLTVPSGKDGKWHIFGKVNWGPSTAANTDFIARLKKNGTTVVEDAVIAGDGTGQFAPANIINITLSLVATDYVEIEVRQTSGGALNVQSADMRSFFGMQFIGA